MTNPMAVRQKMPPRITSKSPIVFRMGLMNKARATMATNTNKPIKPLKVIGGKVTRNVGFRMVSDK